MMKRVVTGIIIFLKDRRTIAKRYEHDAETINNSNDTNCFWVECLRLHSGVADADTHPDAHACSQRTRQSLRHEALPQL